MNAGLSNPEILKRCFADLTQTHSPGQDPKVVIYFHTISSFLRLKMVNKMFFSVFGDIPGERDGHSACVIGNFIAFSDELYILSSFSDHYMYVFGGYEEIIERFAIFCE